MNEQHQKGGQNRFRRFFRWMAIVLIVLVILIPVGVHLPFVQDMIAARGARYLSEKTGGEFSIGKLRFSIFGKISLQELVVNEPNGDTLGRVDKLEFRTHIPRLLRKDILLDDLVMDGVALDLRQSGEDMNLDFIIDAFSGSDTMESGPPSQLDIRSNSLCLRNIDFSFTEDESVLHVVCGDLCLDGSALSIAPNEINIDSAALSNVSVDYVSNAPASTTNAADSAITLPPLDLGSGFEIAIGHLAIDSTDIIYRLGEEIAQDKFDPGNISISHLLLNADALRAGDAGLGAELQQLKGDFGAIPIDSISFFARAEAESSEVTDLHLEAGRSTLRGNLDLDYKDWINLPAQIDEASGLLEFEGLIAKSDLEYLLPDSIVDLISEWTDIVVESEIAHSRRTTNIKQLSVVTGTSQFQTTGEFRDISTMDQMSWSEGRVRAKIGSEFAGTIRSFSDEVRLPEDLSFDVRTDGRIESFDAHARINSAWGKLNASGNYGYADAQFLIDSDIDGRDIGLNSILGLDWADSCDIDIALTGSAGNDLALVVDGRIVKIGIMEHDIDDILVSGRLTSDSVFADIESRDRYFSLSSTASIALSDTLDINAFVSLDSFALGRLLDGDTSLYTSADLDIAMLYVSEMLGGDLSLRNIAVANTRNTYEADSLDVQFLSSADSSRLWLQGDDLSGLVTANFDVRKLQTLVDSNVSGNLLINPDLFTSDHRYEANLEVLNSAPFDILNLETERFTSLSLQSQLNIGSEALTLDLRSGELEVNDLAIDTLDLSLQTDASGVTLSALIDEIVYDSLVVGRLLWNAEREEDGIHNRLRLIKDSTESAGIRAIVSREGRDVHIRADSIIVLGDFIDVSDNAPIIVSDSNVYFDEFAILHEDAEVMLDGDLEQFLLDISDLPVYNLDAIFLGKEDLVNRGLLNASIDFDARERKFDGTLTIDSIQFYTTPPLNVIVNATSDKDRIPFDLNIENASNTIRADGAYSFSDNSFDANARLNIQELNTFEFLTENILEKMDGSLTGDVHVQGPTNALTADGQLRFVDTDIILLRPRSEFRIEDDVITFTEKGIGLNEFTLKDIKGTPLVLNGQLETDDYKSFNYDLNIKTDNYVLIDEPKRSGQSISGIFALGADIDITGSRDKLNLDANFRVSDTTDITYVMPQKNVELITGAGIVEFVDPTLPEDSLSKGDNMSYLDSIMASLPTLDLNSTVRITDRSKFKVVIDERSGDYVEASGKANVTLNMDRTGNIRMTGTYEIGDGTYQLSFFDLVQKRFKLAKDSRIQWNGAPDQGSIDVTATYTTQTSSVGLVGNEVSESETYLYRRALPYTIRIIIKGTIDKPEVSFGLDLPQKYRMEYPVLDNKLSRLEQPEFESERNKQVFGLLVVGGFIPESTGDFDEMAVATTAIANSVNSLLAAQLNRLTNKIKGVDINIGLQSYSDFESGAGMRTAVDFSVSKRLADDRLSIEVGGEMDVGSGQSTYAYSDGFRSDITVIYDLTESGNTKLKAFNNETYDIVYHEIRNTGIALIFVREFNKGEGILSNRKKKKKE